MGLAVFDAEKGRFDRFIEETKDGLPNNASMAS